MTADDIAQKDAVLLAILPEVPFDGWTWKALRAATAHAGFENGDGAELFPDGPRDLVAWFSHWADRRTLAALADSKQRRLRTRERIALGVRTRLRLLFPHREAVRRALSLLAMPRNLPLGATLLYDTVDALWYGAGDISTDFSFYTKRGLLAAVYAATTLYWLDDRSDDASATDEFLDRRLDEVLAIPRLRRAAEQLLNPFRMLRSARSRFSGAG